MADLSGWWDDYFWAAMTVLKVFGVSLIMTVIFGLIGAVLASVILPEHY